MHRQMANASACGRVEPTDSVRIVPGREWAYINLQYSSISCRLIQMHSRASNLRDHLVTHIEVLAVEGSSFLKRKEW